MPLGLCSIGMFYIGMYPIGIVQIAVFIHISKSIMIPVHHSI